MAKQLSVGGMSLHGWNSAAAALAGLERWGRDIGYKSSMLLASGVGC